MAARGQASLMTNKPGETGSADEAPMPADGVYYVTVGKERKRVAVKSERLDVDALKEERKAIEEKLATIPGEPDDKELLAWAREHYPRMDYSANRAALEARIAEIKEALGD